MAGVLATSPLSVGKFGLRWSIRFVAVVIALIAAVIISAIEYSLFYYATIPQVYQQQEIVFQPDDTKPSLLQAMVVFENQFEQEGELYEGSAIRLKNEVYNFQVVFEQVAETQ